MRYIALFALNLTLVGCSDDSRRAPFPPPEDAATDQSSQCVTADDCVLPHGLCIHCDGGLEFMCPHALCVEGVCSVTQPSCPEMPVDAGDEQ